MNRIVADDDLQRRINAATSTEELRGLLMQKGVQDGVLRKQADGSYTPVAPESRAEKTQTYQKVIHVNGFALELTASSPDKLAALEAIAKNNYAE